MSEPRFRALRSRARLFVAGIILTGAVACAWSFLWAPLPDLDLPLVVFMAFATFAGFVRVPLPIRGNITLGYTFLLAVMLGFGLGAAVLTGVLSVLASGLVASRRSGTPAYQIVYNVALISVATTLAGRAYLGLGGTVGAFDLVRVLGPVLGFTVVFAFINVGLVSLAIHMSGAAEVRKSLVSNLRWSVPAYLAGASMAVMLGMLVASGYLPYLLLAAPFLYLVHSSYQARSAALQEERRHSQQMAEVYSSVSEALALAIEAKDENTEDHLRRVREYCLGIGEILELPREELEVLRLAALLHDIGKIAIPDHILTKPGKLTAEEFELLKIHPVVGAEILDTVAFPFPLAPIVRHHHERWDGSGYPDGLEREAIPVGARVLAVVDTYDAITTDRPYRRALTRPEALDHLRRQSGKMFDPAIVDIMLEVSDALEARVHAGDSDPARATTILSADVADDGRERELLPCDAAGDGRLPVAVLEVIDDLRERIVAARQASGDMPSMDEIAELVDRIVPNRCLVLFELDASRERLVATRCSGEGAGRIRGLEIQVGDKIAGWVVRNQRPYVGTAHVNPIERDGSRFDLEDLVWDPEVASLRSALVVPLAIEQGTVGAVGMYHDGAFGYSTDHVAHASEIAEVLAEMVAAPRDPAGDPAGEH